MFAFHSQPHLTNENSKYIQKFSKLERFFLGQAGKCNVDILNFEYFS